MEVVTLLYFSQLQFEQVIRLLSYFELHFADEVTCKEREGQVSIYEDYEV